MTLTTDILERDNYQCQYCGLHAVQRDHLFSKAEGRRAEIARDDTEFQVACCRDCNEAKGTLRLVPPCLENRIPDFEDWTGKMWRVYKGGPVSAAFRKVHTA